MTPENALTPEDPLLDILACPLDKGPLHLLAAEDVLYNPRLRLRYPILDGIPQLLPSSGEQVPDDEHERLLKRIGSPADAPDETSAGASEGASSEASAEASAETPRDIPGKEPS